MDQPITNSDTMELWLLLLGAVVATYLWRGLGVLLASRIDVDGPFFEWATCVSYAMLAGLIARMTLLPVGPLASTPLFCRMIGIAVGLVAFFLCGRRALLAVGAGMIGFIVLVSVVSV